MKQTRKALKNRDNLSPNVRYRCWVPFGFVSGLGVWIRSWEKQVKARSARKNNGKQGKTRKLKEPQGTKMKNIGNT